LITITQEFEMVATLSSFTQNTARPMPKARQPLETSSQPSLDAFNDLVVTHQDIVFRQALWILGDDAAAEDATQEAFLRAYHHWHTFDGGPFRPWIMRIATNYCLDQLRRSKAHPSTSLEVYTNEDETIENPTWLTDPCCCVEEMVERSELRERIMQAINHLAPVYRMPVILIDLQDFDYQEAAASLGIPLGTFKSRLARARQKLQKWLQ
jgi:RNA polymerase sigma-70 factor (ECF subfamily)